MMHPVNKSNGNNLEAQQNLSWLHLKKLAKVLETWTFLFLSTPKSRFKLTCLQIKISSKSIQKKKDNLRTHLFSRFYIPQIPHEIYSSQRINTAKGTRMLNFKLYQNASQHLQIKTRNSQMTPLPSSPRHIYISTLSNHRIDAPLTSRFADITTHHNEPHCFRILMNYIFRTVREIQINQVYRRTMPEKSDLNKILSSSSASSCQSPVSFSGNWADLDGSKKGISCRSCTLK